MCIQALNITKFIKNLKGFDTVLNKLKVKHVVNGNCTASLIVDEDHLNERGVLNSGFSTTLVDVVSGWALLTHERGAVPSVSVDLHMSFLKTAKAGDVIEIDAKVNKCDETLAFLDVTITNEKDREVVAKGCHTKFLMNS